MVVEPSTMQLKIIIKHLQDEGISLIEGAASGQQALDTLSQYKPDLVISSMYLPDMTAEQLVTSIRESEPLHDMAFMLVSSETHFDKLDPVRQAGVVAILPKPFSHEDLKRALRSTIEFIDPSEISLEHYDIEELRVLVVDDSMMARKHISRVLNNMGIVNITLANDGKEAAEVFRDSQEMFDLIVTDYNMPEMDGQALIEYIRREIGNTFIPILMVTSEENETRLNNVHKAGVSAICDKPFEPDTVREMLYRMLDHGE